MSESLKPYAQNLVIQIKDKKDQKINIKLRTLLKGFGFARRTQTVVDQVNKQLSAVGLVTELSVSFPVNLDDKITIQLGQLDLQKEPQKKPLQIKDNPIDSRTAIKKAIGATVVVIAGNFSGSGFIVSESGLLITARHVVENQENISLREVDVILHPQKPEEKSYKGMVIASNRQMDYAFIWLEGTESFPVVAVGNSIDMQQSDTVYAIGAPLGMPNTLSRGIISNPDALFNGVKCLQTDAAIDHGNSGGPLINEYGEVVGINLWGKGNSDALKFAVPTDLIKEKIHEYLEKGRNTCVSSLYCRRCGDLQFNKAGNKCPICQADYDHPEKGPIEPVEIMALPNNAIEIMAGILKNINWI